MAEPDDIQKTLDEQKRAKEAQKSAESMIEHLESINEAVEQNSQVTQLGIGMLLDNFKTVFDYTKATDKTLLATDKRKDKKISELIKITKSDNIKFFNQRESQFESFFERTSLANSDLVSSISQMSNSTDLITGTSRLLGEQQQTTVAIMDSAIVNAFGLKAVKDQLVENAVMMDSLFSGFAGLLMGQVPEKSEISQQIRGEQEKQITDQNERLVDRDIQSQTLLVTQGMSAKLDNIGGGGGGDDGGGGGGIMSTIMSMLDLPFKKMFSFATKGFKGLFGKAWSGFKGMASKTGKFISKGASFVKNAGGKLLGKVGQIGSKLGSIAGRAGGIVSKVGGRALGMLGPAAAIAGAAVAGWQVGTWIDEKFGVSDKLADMIAGPSAAEIIASKVEDKSFGKQETERKKGEELKAQASEATGLSKIEMDLIARGGKIDTNAMGVVSEDTKDAIVGSIEAEKQKAIEKRKRAEADLKLAEEEADHWIGSASKEEKLKIAQAKTQVDAFKAQEVRLEEAKQRAKRDVIGMGRLSDEQKKSLELEKQKSNQKMEEMNAKQAEVREAEAEASTAPTVEVKTPPLSKEEQDMIKKREDAKIKALESIANSSQANANKKTTYPISSPPRRSATQPSGGMPA